jgi:hypothetical protein
MAREAVTFGRLLLFALAMTGLLACEGADTQPPAADATTPATTPSPVAAPAAISPAPAPPVVRVDTMKDASPNQTGAGAYRYSVQVPQLEGDAPRIMAIDAAIKGALQRDIDAFVGGARAAPADPTLSDLTCQSRTIRLTSRLAVLRVDCTDYHAGAAHPNTATRTFNCDLRAGHVLSLQDLFSGGSGYLEVLSTAARAQLRADGLAVDEQTLDEGTAPVVDNFKSFLLQGGALVVVFATYQVAPGAAGQPEISVPYDDLQRYLARGITELLPG